MMALKHTQAKGNAFAQGQHGGGTLVNRTKFGVQAVQWVDTSFPRNNVVVFALSTLDRICGDSDDSVRMTDLEDDCEGRALSSPSPALTTAARRARGRRRSRS
jgi:hypothetical protein